MDFAYSPQARHYIERLTVFMREQVLPAETEYFSQLKRGARPWNVPPVMLTLKAKAKAAGLWNLFLPDAEFGAGLSNTDYAPLAEIMGRSPIAPEVFNCFTTSGWTRSITSPRSSSLCILRISM